MLSDEHISTNSTCMKLCHALFLLTAFLSISVSGVHSQELKVDSRLLKETNVVELNRLSAEWGAQAEKDYAIAEAKAKVNGWIIRETDDEGAVVQLIRLDENGNPVYYKTDNHASALVIGTVPARNTYGLTGAGINIGEWDGGNILQTHEQYNGRVTNHNNSTNDDHATHVCGTLIGDGTGKAAAKGMAPRATVDGYNFRYDISEMAAEAAAGMILSNHSYGTVSGWSAPGSCSTWSWHGTRQNVSESNYFGLYSSSARSWDKIANNAPYYLMVKSAGNDRGQRGTNPHREGDQPCNAPTSNQFHEADGGTDGYDCIPTIGNAKNILTVAAMQNQLPTTTSFSSWGPTDDGRIKPDIGADGRDLESAWIPNNNSYATISGTSMAAPSVTGSCALLQEHYYNTHNSSFMRSATLKAVVIHSATDVGSPGPDYSQGWGRMNTFAAANLIEQDKVVTNVIQEETLVDSGTYSFTVFSRGNAPLSATLVWNDPAGSSRTALNSRTSSLVNDLDIRISWPAATYEPWILDPANPSFPATTGDNVRDNVEKVFIQNPSAGYYTITVSHKGTLRGGAQAFSLITSGFVIAPLNDLRANATPVSCGSTTRASNMAATNDRPLPVNNFCGTNVSSVGYGVWFSFVPSSTSPVTLSTCSPATDFNTKISVFKEDCGGFFTCEAGNDDDASCTYNKASTVTFTPSEANVEYFILVHGFGTAYGLFDLSVSGCSDGAVIPDRTPPVINCPSNITKNNSPGSCDAPGGFTVTAIDACDGDISSDVVCKDQNGHLVTSASLFPVGAHTVFCDISDTKGNAASCSFNIVIHDAEDPQITCPSDIRVGTDPNRCDAVVNFADPTITDNCPGLGAPQTASMPAQSGTFVSEARGYYFTAPADMVITGLQVPTDASTSAQNVQVLLIPTFADTFGRQTLFWRGQVTGSGFIPVSIPVDSGQQIGILGTRGNNSTNSYSPSGSSISIDGKSVRVTRLFYRGDIHAAAAPNSQVMGGTSNISRVNFTYRMSGFFPACSHTSGSVFSIGITTVNCSVSDASGRTADCSFTVRVNDDQPIAITCPSDIVRDIDPGTCGKAVTFPNATVVENCLISGGRASCSHISGSIFPAGVTTVTCTASDFTYTRQCTFTITINDTIPPVLNCPSVIHGTGPGACQAVVTYSSISTTDNCPGTTNIVCTPASGSIFPVGTSSVSCVATDSAGNTATCSFTVTVNDSTAPVMICPPAITVDADSNCNYVVEDFRNLGKARDNCDPISYGLKTVAARSVNTLAIRNDGVVVSWGDVSSGALGRDTVGAPSNLPHPVQGLPTNTSWKQVASGLRNHSILGEDGTIWAWGRGIAGSHGIGSTGNVSRPRQMGSDTDWAQVARGDEHTLAIKNDGTLWAWGFNGEGQCGQGTFTTRTYLRPVQVGTDTNWIFVDAGAEYSLAIKSDSSLWACGHNDFGMLGLGDQVDRNTMTQVGTDTDWKVVSGGYYETYALKTDGSLWSWGRNHHGQLGLGFISNAAIGILVPTRVGRANDWASVAAGFEKGSAIKTDSTLWNWGRGQDYGHGLGDQNRYTTPQQVGTDTDWIMAEGSSRSGYGLKGNGQLWSWGLGFGFNGRNTDHRIPGQIDHNGLLVSLPTGNSKPVITQSPVALSNITSGVHSITLMATDTSNNTSSCSFTITVNDTISPLIVCPADGIVANDSGVCEAVIYYTDSLAATGTDNCSGLPTIRYSPAAGSTLPLGTTAVQATATDISGNTASCMFNITVNDTTAPLIICPANITTNNDSGLCSAVVNFSPTSSDNCSSAQTSGSAASGTAFPVGTTTVVSTATDAAGNSSQCSFTITVNDTTLPVLSCPGNVTVNTLTGSCRGIATFTGATVIDNCSGVGPISYNRVSGDTFSIGITTITCSATDAYGNTDSCTFDVIVIDNEEPVISCPANITVANDSGACEAAVTYPHATAIDNCSIPNPPTCSPVSGSTFPVGTSTVTCVVADLPGNMDTCTFEIIVNDTTPPTVTCPADIITDNDSALCSAVVSFSPTSSDNCFSTQTSSSPASGTAFPVGTTTVVSTATDAAGNSSQCSFTITVNDTSPPMITCPQHIIQSNDSGLCGASIHFMTIQSDNCPGVQVSHTPRSGSFFAVGASTVTSTARDSTGNMSQCMFTVTILDTEAPVISSCPASIAACENDTVFYSQPLFDDNCDGSNLSALIQAGQVSGTVFPVGTNNVEYSYTDNAGNSETCTFEVYIYERPQAPSRLIRRCDGVNVAFNLQNHINNRGNGIKSNFKWLASPVAGVTGISTNPQAGSVINDFLINTTFLNKRVVYTISPEGDSLGCAGADFTITVNLRPSARIQMLQANVCPGNRINLASLVRDFSLLAARVNFYNAHPDSGGVQIGTARMRRGIAQASDKVLVSPNQNTTYWVTGLTADGCEQTLSFDITISPNCNTTVASIALLQGAYDTRTGLQRTSLYQSALLPTREPYTALGYAFYGGGAEVLNLMPGTNPAIVDWVVVELRDPIDPSIVVYSRAALLLDNGAIVDTDGQSPVVMSARPRDRYYVSVFHRNHLGVMTGQAVQMGTTIDFSDTTLNVYGAHSRATLGGRALLFGGDADGNGEVQNSDYIFKWARSVGGSGYKSGDYNLDGQVQNSDMLRYWLPNVGRGGTIPK